MRRILAAFALALAMLVAAAPVAMAGQNGPHGPPAGCKGYEGQPGNNPCH